MPLDCMGGNHLFVVERPMSGMTCLCGDFTIPEDGHEQPEPKFSHRYHSFYVGDLPKDCDA